MAGQQTLYHQTNLVSDQAGTAATTDPNLVNAWGLSHGPTTPWWISDNGAGVATLYSGAGVAAPSGAPLVVIVPPPGGSPAGIAATPTGTVFNGTNSFVVADPATGKSGPALFLFATEDGTISGWNPTVNAQRALLKVDNSTGDTGAVYKGLALGRVGSSDFLYAANFRAGTIDVFDGKFAPVHSSGAFTDATIPAGFAPFNIQNFGGMLYVTYAKQDGDKHDDVAGPGNGFIDVYMTSGQLVRRLASQGPLSSPWGLALAPSDFGTFSGDLLVGNFGDGRINAFDPSSGAFRGPLEDEKGHPIAIPGLWGLAFGNGSTAGPATTLFFTAGIDHEAHGLFGSLARTSDAGASSPPSYGYSLG
jgi:uncharacterized protein (TIGR03118 family)